MIKKGIECNFRCVGFLKRFVATFIDGLIISPIVLVLYFSGINLYNEKTIGAYIILNSISYLYSILLPVFFGGTVGKLLLKIKIVNSEGNNISFIQSTLRWSPYLLSFIVMIVLAIITKQGVLFSILGFISKVLNYFTLIEAVVLLVNKSNRTIHDYLANTYVIEK